MGKKIHRDLMFSRTVKIYSVTVLFAAVPLRARQHKHAYYTFSWEADGV